MAKRAPLAIDTDGTSSLREICTGNYGELQWIIPDIMPLEGVTMLVGSPKSGKSLFLLNVLNNYLSRQVILDFYPPATGAHKILYLDLESSKRRIKERSTKMHSAISNIPDTMEMAVAWPRFGAGGMSKLRSRLDYEHFGLIVIDTLGKIQAMRTLSNTHSYSIDQQEIDKFTRICRDYDTSIVLVHHTRKAKSSDWVDMVSGSHGISGAVDTLLYLYREDGQTGAALHAKGRDVDEESYRLSFNRETNSWSMLGNLKHIMSPLTTAQREIFDLLNATDGVLTPTQISKRIKKAPSCIKMHLANLVASGVIIRYGYGEYGKKIKI